MLRNAFRSPIPQNHCWTRLPTYSVPSWWLSSCICLNISITAGWLAQSRFGCSKSSLIVALLSRPFNRNMLSLSTNGESLARSCFTLSPLLSSILLKSSAKLPRRIIIEIINSAFCFLQRCHGATLLWSKSKTINNHVDHSFVFTKPWPIYDALCRISHQSDVVIIHYLCWVWPVAWILLEPGRLL